MRRRHGGGAAARGRERRRGHGRRRRSTGSTRERGAARDRARAPARRRARARLEHPRPRRRAPGSGSTSCSRRCARDTPSEHERAVARGARGVAGRSAPREERSFPWVQTHTTAELLDRIASVSFVARPRRRPRARRCSRGCARRSRALPQPFEFRYRTDVSCSRVSRRPGPTGRRRCPSRRGSRREIRAATCVEQRAVVAAVRDELGDAVALELDRDAACAPSGRCAPASGPRTSSPFSTKRIPAQSQPPLGDEHVDDRAQHVVGVAASVEDSIDRLERRVILELRHARAERVRHGHGPARVEVDQHERLLRRRHQHVASPSSSQR